MISPFAEGVLASITATAVAGLMTTIFSSLFRRMFVNKVLEWKLTRNLPRDGASRRPSLQLIVRLAKFLRNNQEKDSRSPRYEEFDKNLRHRHITEAHVELGAQCKASDVCHGLADLHSSETSCHSLCEKHLAHRGSRNEQANGGLLDSSSVARGSAQSTMEDIGNHKLQAHHQSSASSGGFRCQPLCFIRTEPFVSCRSQSIVLY
jgi:hypothetical protein